jgi:hypothetical protein
MGKPTWEADASRKARCEVCKGSFGLVRHRYVQRQFGSEQCVEWYKADMITRVSSYKQPIDPASR